MRVSYLATGFQEQAFQAVKAELQFSQGPGPGSEITFFGSFDPHFVDQNKNRLALWQGGGQERGRCRGACGMDSIVTAIFRNIVHHRILSLESLSCTPGHFSQNLKKQWGAPLVRCSVFTFTLRSSVWLFLAHARNMAFQCARLLPLFWAIPIREIKNNLSAVNFFLYSCVFPRLLLHTLMLNTVVFIVVKSMNSW